MSSTRVWVGAVISGAFSVVFALAATYIFSLLFPAVGLAWALIAVMFAAFFAGAAGYLNGIARAQVSPQESERARDYVPDA